jgi:hypothetical protein
VGNAASTTRRNILARLHVGGVSWRIVVTNVALSAVESRRQDLANERIRSLELALNQIWRGGRQQRESQAIYISGRLWDADVERHELAIVVGVRELRLEQEQLADVSQEVDE